MPGVRMAPMANLRPTILAVLEKIAHSLEDDTQQQRSTSVAKKSIRLDYHNTIKYIYVAQSLTTTEYK